MDVLKSAANETEPADTQRSCRPTESDLGAQQVGDLAIRFRRLLLLWGRYASNHAINNVAGNITRQQASILDTLIDLGPVRMSDLAASELTRAPTARNSVLRLLRLGLVTRWRDPLDHRVVRIAITARGRTARRRAVAARTQRIAAGLAQLNRQDREALRGALPLLELMAQTADTTGSLAGPT